MHFGTQIKEIEQIFTLLIPNFAAVWILRSKMFLVRRLVFIHTFSVKLWFNHILKYQIPCRQTKLKEKVLPVLNYITNEEAFQYPGGVPTSMVKSGQQWDLR